MYNLLQSHQSKKDTSWLLMQYPLM